MVQRNDSATRLDVASVNESKANNLPAEVRSGQWAVWGYGSDRPGKRPKIPARCRADHTSRTIRTDNPEDWVSFDQALTEFETIRDVPLTATGYEWTAAGIGRLCSSEPELTVFDFDNCVEGGVIAPEILEVLKLLKTYAEISPSGHGVRAACVGGKDPQLRLRGEVGKLHGFGTEIYDSTSIRYTSFTGNVIEGFEKIRATPAAASRHLIEHWRSTPKDGSHCGSTHRLVSEHDLDALLHAFEHGAPPPHPVVIDWTRFMYKDGAVDRSAAFAAAYGAAHKIGGFPVADCMLIALDVLGDNMEDKGLRRVVIEGTGEARKVPFAVADTISLSRYFRNRDIVKAKIRAAFDKDFPALQIAQTLLDGFPEQGWLIGFYALRKGANPRQIGELIGADTLAAILRVVGNGR